MSLDEESSARKRHKGTGAETPVSLRTLRRWEEKGLLVALPDKETSEAVWSSHGGQEDDSNEFREENSLSDDGSDSSDVDTEDDILCDSDRSIVDSDSETCSSTDGGSLGEVSEIDSEPEGSLGKLYEGSVKSTDEAVLAVFDLYTRHKLSKVCLGDILKTFSVILPDLNNLPKSWYLLLQYVVKFASEIGESKHLYCKTCMFFFNTEQVIPCPVPACESTEVSEFYSLSVVDQLKHLLEHRRLADLLDMNNARHSDARFICDVTDGSEYKRVRQQVSGQYDITLMWNTDGVSLSRSSLADLWPLQFVILEVPPQFREYFLIVAGIWFDDRKPNMNIFLRPFAESLKDLYSSGGFVWTHPTSKQSHTSQVTAPLVCADAPARAQVQNIKQHNSIYGCNVCEQKAAKLRPLQPQLQGGPVQNISTKRIFAFQEVPARVRTGARMERHSQVAFTKNESKKGVKGPAIISILPMIDRATCVVPEYMHSVLLGVVLQFLMLWFTVPGPWNISKYRDEIDDFLVRIKPPDFITRMPRSSSVFIHWKANELRSWLLYYSLPALAAFMPQDFLQHWILLVHAIFILLQDKISYDEIQAARHMLNLFVRDIGNLYRMKDYSYNVHQLLHLTLCVERWGPLFSTSAFMFENNNGVLKNLIHGSRLQGKELVNNLKITFAVQILRSRVENSPFTRNPRVTNDQVMGKSLNIELDPVAQDLLLTSNCCTVGIHARAKILNVVYSSAIYSFDKKRNNSFVYYETENAKGYGEIQVFIKSDNDTIYCLIKLFAVYHVNMFVHEHSRTKVRHYIPLVSTDQVLLIQSQHIIHKVIRIGKFVCLRPNTLERNLEVLLSEYYCPSKKKDTHHFIIW